MRRKVVVLFLLSLILCACGNSKPRDLTGAEISMLSPVEQKIVNEHNYEVITAKYLEKHSDDYCVKLSESSFDDYFFLSGKVTKVETNAFSDSAKKILEKDGLDVFIDDKPRYNIYLDNVDIPISFSTYDLDIKEGKNYLFFVEASNYTQVKCLASSYYLIDEDK